MADPGSERALELPDELLLRVESRVEHTDFDSVEEYVTYVLEDVLHHVEQRNEVPDEESVDEEEVKDRLESLGYLD